jgi:hypothetical protein
MQISTPTRIVTMMSMTRVHSRPPDESRMIGRHAFVLLAKPGIIV